MHASFVLFDCRWKGIRDDIMLVLDEEISSVNLCALHCELRNMEQLLKSLGLFSHEIGSLDQCNKILAEIGPSSFKKKRITVKKNPGQESRMKKCNVKVSSFSGWFRLRLFMQLVFNAFIIIST
jgi:hypothetical protein